jgi:hypothetical protein
MDEMTLPDLPEEELIKLIMERLGMDEEDARLYLAIERGEVESDVIETAFSPY